MIIFQQDRRDCKKPLPLASDRYMNSRMPKRACYEVKQEIEPYSSQFYGSDHFGAQFYAQSYLKKYCTLDSSSAAESPISTQASSISGSCLTDESDDLKHKLRELETAMLGPDDPDILLYTNYDNRNSDFTLSWGMLTDPVNLRQVLVDSARAVSEDDVATARCLLQRLRGMVSVSGEPVERLGAYMLEGLVARLASSGSSIYWSLRCRDRPERSDLLSYMHILYEVCPYFKFGYMSANGAIAEAMKDEKRVHIVDFQIGQGSQWITLIQAFAARPGGPPRIRITGLDDPDSAYARGGGLGIVGRRLSRLAETFGVPFEFHVAVVSGRSVKPEDLNLRPGEALAVNFAFVLHRMPDESVTTQNHRDRVLRMVKGLEPKVVTLVEQESNTNTAPFLPRFLEALDYYNAMFESIDVTMPRDCKERIEVEQHCLARDVVNIIACEGAERVERHELLGKWRSRFSMAGFGPYPLSPLVNGTIRTLLANYSHKYRLEERDGAIFLGWMDRDLVASSAWK